MVTPRLTRERQTQGHAYTTRRDLAIRHRQLAAVVEGDTMGDVEADPQMRDTIRPRTMRLHTGKQQLQNNLGYRWSLVENAQLCLLSFHPELEKDFPTRHGKIQGVVFHLVE